MTTAKDGIHSVEQICDRTYRIDENGMANCYLLLGGEKALLIDSGVGVGNLKGVINEITSLPVTLAATHRHCDHTGGRDFFPEYYVHKDDKDLIYAVLSSRLACKQLAKMNGSGTIALSPKPFHSKIRFFDESKTFDLGGRTLWVMHVPGHTKGSVVFIDDKNHLMFTGDAVNPYLWMQLPGCTCLSQWLPGARQVLALADEYSAYCGHNNGLITRQNIADLIAVVEELLRKKPRVDGKELDYPDKDAEIHVLVSKGRIK